MTEVAMQIGTQTFWSAPFHSVKRSPDTARLRVAVGRDGPAAPLDASRHQLIVAAAGLEANPRMRPRTSAQHGTWPWSAARLSTPESAWYTVSRPAMPQRQGTAPAVTPEARGADAGPDVREREASSELTKS
ncbi:hypothetical protein J3458_000385 [Metarhizium acridum]|uniref:uncharacterized protein n=1 Tax=Metarhizium acridum TaxID=92637 RepID=UPI001C6CE56C|nr:hypothetical protein J3458_000385 [Metarhizium acridum]